MSKFIRKVNGLWKLVYVLTFGHSLVRILAPFDSVNCKNKIQNFFLRCYGHLIYYTTSLIVELLILLLKKIKIKCLGLNIKSDSLNLESLILIANRRKQGTGMCVHVIVKVKESTKSICSMCNSCSASLFLSVMENEKGREEKGQVENKTLQ